MNDGGPNFQALFDLMKESMSLRDRFAGLALAVTETAWVFQGATPEMIAKKAYKIADAMLKEREKEKMP